MQALSAKDAKCGFGRLVDLPAPSRWQWPSMDAPSSWRWRERFERLKAPEERTQSFKKEAKG
jgi:hypothetical protein